MTANLLKTIIIIVFYHNYTNTLNALITINLYGTFFYKIAISSLNIHISKNT